MTSSNVSKPVSSLGSRLLRPFVAIVAAIALFVSASAYAEPPRDTLGQTQQLKQSSKAGTHARGKRSKKRVHAQRKSTKTQRSKKGSKAKAHGQASKKKTSR